MPTFNYQGIIDNLVSTVGALVSGSAIAGTALTSSTTVSRVEKKLVTADQLGAGELTLVCIIPSDVQPDNTYYPFNDIATNLDLWIIAHARAEDDNARTERSSGLERDIRAAFAADPTRGFWAVETIERGGKLSDEGWPDVRGVKGGTVTISIPVQVLYYPNDGGT